MDEGYAPISEDIAVLTPQSLEESFENVLDVPFVTVNKIDGQCVAEVKLSGDEMYDRLRLSRAFQAAAAHGQTGCIQQHGNDGLVYLYFHEGGL